MKKAAKPVVKIAFFCMIKPRMGLVLESPLQECNFLQQFYSVNCGKIALGKLLETSKHIHFFRENQDEKTLSFVLKGYTNPDTNIPCVPVLQQTVKRKKTLFFVMEKSILF